MKALWQSREQADYAGEKLRKFAQPQRLMILSLLLEGEKSVAEIDVATGIGQPALSQQLAELRKAELVTTRRQAKQVYYSLADESVVLCVRSIEAVFGAGDPERALLDMVRPASRPERNGVVRGAANFARVR
ncbi:metalloregulator ArsR/SmtB family transcription factor [Bosea sp. AS-1]|uniref:ArsR/SmtB family transcription factor n=1 Tax=Bosea sp. AS-1 TaxID=2015316 RepID=UPI000B785097|nr:metalloregulator ArsR/SmtB family transcription factor [Bosea sp. AS-1]